MMTPEQLKETENVLSEHGIIEPYELRYFINAYEDLKAENERLKAENTWRPIKTAPKNGSEILTFSTPRYGGSGIIVQHWYNCWRGETWYDHSEEYGDSGATDWRPLPQPPKQSEVTE
jgi:hypothetical protein